MFGIILTAIENYECEIGEFEVLSLWSVICRLSSVLRGVLMTNKTLFWSFYVSFCTFYASLRLTRTVFTRLQIRVRPKGLHNFAFYILIFDFSLQPLTPRPQSLTPNPQSLTPRLSSLPPDLWPLTPNVIVHKYLRACKTLYNCREDSTTIESSLQINLFMQNKANFQKVKLNVTKVLTKKSS
jgi:hypothetical protein